MLEKQRSHDVVQRKLTKVDKENRVNLEPKPPLYKSRISILTPVEERTSKSAETKKRKKRSVSVKRWIRLKDGTQVEIPKESYSMLMPLYEEKNVQEPKIIKNTSRNLSISICQSESTRSKVQTTTVY